MSVDVDEIALKKIPLTLIDEPAITMRQTFDEEGLMELADSIRKYGLLQPAGLRQRGDRYVIIFGHRRFVASTLAGKETMRSLIFPEDVSDEEAMKAAENIEREDVNPADEAKYYAELLEKKCDGNIDRLAGMTGRKIAYLESRLEFLRGDPDVLAAMAATGITMAVARELNRVKDKGYRMSYLRSAIETGATASSVRNWRLDYEKNERYLLTGKTAEDVPVAPGQYSIPNIACVCCGMDQDPGNLEIVYIHRGGPCAQMLKRFMRATRGEGE